MLKEFFDNALRDLFSYRGKTKRNGQVELRDKWNQNPHGFSRNSDYFYQHEAGDSYLYDLAHWHSSKTIYSWGNKVHGNAHGIVWDFGGGIGTYSLLCAAKDTVETVYYDDINPENQEFAKWRFKKYGLMDKIVIGTPRNAVDTIIALDVVEHLDDPIGQMVRFNIAAKQGTQLVVNITAHDSNGEHPMHIMGPNEAAVWWKALAKRWKRVIAGDPSVWSFVK